MKSDNGRTYETMKPIEEEIIKRTLVKERLKWRRGLLVVMDTETTNLYPDLLEKNIELFRAKPIKEKRKMNVMRWECVVPGIGLYEDALIPIVIDFRISLSDDRSEALALPKGFISEIRGYGTSTFKLEKNGEDYVTMSCHEYGFSGYRHEFYHKLWAPFHGGKFTVLQVLLLVQKHFCDGSKWDTSKDNYRWRKPEMTYKEFHDKVLNKYKPLHLRRVLDDDAVGVEVIEESSLKIVSAVAQKKRKGEEVEIVRNNTIIQRVAKEKGPEELYFDQCLIKGDRYEWACNVANNVERPLKECIGKFRTPFLCLDWPQVESNIDTMLHFVKRPENWRPHVKTTKMMSVWRLLLQKGVFKFKCSTIKELHHLLATIEFFESEQKKSKELMKYDILLAHPLVLEEQCKDVRALALAYSTIKINVLIEAAETFEETTLLLFRDKCLMNWDSSMDDPVLLKNVGFFLDFSNGMDRTGFSMKEKISEGFFKTLMKYSWSRTRFSGISVYEGHVDDCVGYDKEKINALKALWKKCNEEIVNFLECKTIDVKRGGSLDILEANQDSDQLIKANKNEPTLEIVTSGTPNFHYALDEYLDSETGKMHMKEKFFGRAISRTVSPGTVIFFDHRSHMQVCGAQETMGRRLRPSLYVAAHVVSKPGKKDGISYTLNAGSKSIAAEAGSPMAVVTPSSRKHTSFRVEDNTFWKQTKCSEEHLTFDVIINEEYSQIEQDGRDVYIKQQAAYPKIGDLVLMVPRHVCPTVNLHEHVVVFNRDSVKVHEVNARGHDVKPVSINDVEELRRSVKLYFSSIDRRDF